MPDSEASAAEHRYTLFRLCLCPKCDGEGKLTGQKRSGDRCPECRGEGRIRDHVAECDTLDDVALAFKVSVEEGAWLGCGLGLLDRQGEVHKKWLVPLWPPTARTESAAGRALAVKRWEGQE